MADERLLDVATRLASRLAPGDLEETLSAITRAAVETLPEVQRASISLTHDDGRLETVAPTDPALEELDRIQYELREGPCYLAAVDEVTVVSSDLRHDERFPRYGLAAAERGIGAQAGLNLFARPRSRAALNLYAHEPGSLDDLSRLGPLFAHQAAMALAYATEVDNLRIALDTRTAIGRAVGIVMERYRLDEERAFAFLTRLSQHRNVKLRVVADEIAATVPTSDE